MGFAKLRVATYISYLSGACGYAGWLVVMDSFCFLIRPKKLGRGETKRDEEAFKCISEKRGYMNHGSTRGDIERERYLCTLVFDAHDCRKCVPLRIRHHHPPFYAWSGGSHHIARCVVWHMAANKSIHWLALRRRVYIHICSIYDMCDVCLCDSNVRVSCVQNVSKKWKKCSYINVHIMWHDRGRR